jgi:hypothetical protein
MNPNAEAAAIPYFIVAGLGRQKTIWVLCGQERDRLNMIERKEMQT